MLAVSGQVLMKEAMVLSHKSQSDEGRKVNGTADPGHEEKGNGQKGFLDRWITLAKLAISKSLAHIADNTRRLDCLREVVRKCRL